MNTMMSDYEAITRSADYGLYKRYKAGEMSLEDCARAFCRYGWTDFADKRFTLRRFAEIEHELEYYCD